MFNQNTVEFHWLHMKWFMLGIPEKKSYYPGVIGSSISLFFIVKWSLLPVVVDRTRARFFLSYSSRKYKLCSEMDFRFMQVFSTQPNFLTYRLKHCKKHRNLCCCVVLQSYSFLLVKTQEWKFERLVWSMLSLTLLLFKVTLETPMIVKVVWSRIDWFYIYRRIFGWAMP